MQVRVLPPLPLGSAANAAFPACRGRLTAFPSSRGCSALVRSNPLVSAIDWPTTGPQPLGGRCRVWGNASSHTRGEGGEIPGAAGDESSYRDDERATQRVLRLTKLARNHVPTRGSDPLNYAVSVIFRAIPLAMMAVCVGFGLYVWTAGDASGNFVAGRVVTFLGAICLCLFCTAATIIRQLIGRYTTLDRIVWPTIGYVAAAGNGRIRRVPFHRSVEQRPERAIRGRSRRLRTGIDQRLRSDGRSGLHQVLAHPGELAVSRRRSADSPGSLPSGCRAGAGRHTCRAGDRRLVLLDRQPGHDDHASTVHGGPRRRRSGLDLHEPDRAWSGASSARCRTPTANGIG